MNRRMLAAALSAPLVACAAPAQTDSALSGSVWQFTLIDDQPPASQEARLTIEDDRIGANVGCNGMAGPWRIEHGRLIAGPLVQTQKYCEGRVWNQERAVGALLAAAPRLSVEGDRMVLKASGRSAELQRVDVSPRQ